VTARFVGTFSPGTPEWRAHRADKIGGSDVAAIVGLSGWDAAYSLWHQRKGLIEPPAEKPQMTWGKRVEPIIVAAWAENHPEVYVHYAPGAVYAHPDRPWQVASPDALIYESEDAFLAGADPIGGLEAKTSRYDDGWGVEGSQDIPSYYSTQVQWCLDVFQVPTWEVAALFGGSDDRNYTIHAQPHLQELLRENAKDFLDSLSSDVPPPIDGHETTYRAVRELHRDIEDEEVEVGEVGRTWVNAVRALAEAEDAQREAKARLADELGNRRRALLNGQRIASRKSAGVGRPPVLSAVNGLLEKELA
jgi:putative phage-type endonuclease